MNNQRQQYIIEKEFQFSFIKSTLFIVAASLLMFISAQMVFFFRMKSFGVDAGLPYQHIYFQFLKDQQVIMALIGLIAFSLLAMVTLLWALKFSNKIAGPIHRLKTDLQRSLNGEKVEFTFRDQDYFKDLPALIQKFSEKK